MRIAEPTANGNGVLRVEDVARRRVIDDDRVPGSGLSRSCLGDCSSFRGIVGGEQRGGCPTGPVMDRRILRQMR